jgi:hypothetical protein
MAVSELKELTNKASIPASEVKLLIDGQWRGSKAIRWGEVFNPSRGTVIAKVPLCGAEEVDTAVQAAAGALPKWAETPVVERARVMFRFRELMQTHFEELAALVTREHGKTIAEARASVQRGIEMVEFACGIPSLVMGQHLENIADGVDQFSVHGAAVDVSGGDHLREYVRAQAVGKGAAVGCTAGGAGDGGRFARGGAECRAWGQ